ncbi:hypothetical protein DMUE_6301, partial [Dictyocoela muelleri]
PSEIIIDFEQASYLAFKKNFKTAKINGCFFHFCQNIYRFVNIRKLSCLYKSKTDFGGDIKMIMAFAFLQTNCLEENINRFEKYIQSKTYYDDLLKVCKLFKNTYLCNNKEICIFLI